MADDMPTPPRRITARNPRTGALDHDGIAASTADVEAACARARAAQPAWAAAGMAARIETLQALARELLARKDAIAAALETDTGRRRISATEVASVAGSINGWARLADDLPGEDWTAGLSLPQMRHTPQWVPYALVGVVSPWNFPLLLGMIDAIPALVAGCAVVVKPSEVTPRFIAPLNAAIAAVPGLADLLIVLSGDGQTGQDLIDRVDCVCFTGSVATGRKVAVQAASRLIPAFLELGGKDPLIVLESADLDAASDAALRGSVLATGQACQSIERIYVARPVFDDFLERLVEKAAKARLNWPDITAGEVGPIIFERQAQILADQIDDAAARGATVHTGGKIETHGGGLWLRPTVITEITGEMTLMREETFGPILPVIPFETVDEVVDLANDSEYGLSAAVFAGTLEEAEAVGRRLEAGAISLNDAALTAMFFEAAKQAFKTSGIGPSRMGAEGLQRFYRRKALIANTGRPFPLAAFAEDGPPR